jgi:gluconolactonase
VPELYATGFEFAEGPALDPAGNLYVVNYREHGTIGKITPDRKGTIFCDLRKLAPGVSGASRGEGQATSRANGLKVDRQGRLLASDCTLGRLLRIAADGGKVEVLADSWEGQRFKSINDVALDLEGNVFLTDCAEATAENPIGAVYRYDIRTGKVSRIDRGLAFPNGLAVTPDQKHLCVGESQQYRVLIYDLSPEGVASNRRTLIDLPRQTQGQIIGGKFDPDGMVFDKAGRLYVATWEGGVIDVVDVPSGKLIRQYDAGGKQTTNCHFHDGYLYTTVAAKKAVFRLKLGVEGFDYNGRN